MQQIADWLEKLGMSEYAERFAENRIDFSVLRDLTDQDLKDLRVVLGDRRKMLRSIAELAGAVPASPQPAFAEPKSQDSAERRQVTVMFSDLVGSTALSGWDNYPRRTCARSFRPIRNASPRPRAVSTALWRNTWATGAAPCISAIRRPTRTMPNGRYAQGWEIVAAVTALKSSVSLETRIGIATGLVVWRPDWIR